MSQDRTQASQFALLLRRQFRLGRSWRTRVKLQGEHASVRFTRGPWTLWPSLLSDLTGTRWIAEAESLNGVGPTPGAAMKQAVAAARQMAAHHQGTYRKLKAVLRAMQARGELV